MSQLKIQHPVIQHTPSFKEYKISGQELAKPSWLPWLAAGYWLSLEQ